MTTAEQRQLEIERWIAWIRLGAIPFAIFQVALSSGYPGGYRTAAWLTTALFGAGAILLFLLSRRDLAGRALAGPERCVEVDSAPEEGSVFTLELPIDRSA
jgi:hypothetical protein